MLDGKLESYKYFGVANPKLQMLVEPVRCLTSLEL